MRGAPPDLSSGPSWPAALLAAVLATAVLAAGGCSAPEKNLLYQQQGLFDAYREYIAESIDDPERASELVAVATGLQRQLAADTETLQRMAADLSAANRNYDATRDELAAGFKAINEHRQRMREKILATRVRAVELTTPDEWQELMSRERPLMDLLLGTPGLL